MYSDRYPFLCIFPLALWMLWVFLFIPLDPPRVSCSCEDGGTRLISHSASLPLILRVFTSRTSSPRVVCHLSEGLCWAETVSASHFIPTPQLNITCNFCPATSIETFWLLPLIRCVFTSRTSSPRVVCHLSEGLCWALRQFQHHILAPQFFWLVPLFRCGFTSGTGTGCPRVVCYLSEAQPIR